MGLPSRGDGYCEDSAARGWGGQLPCPYCTLPPDGPPPPIWLDEHGRRVPTWPCPRCGRETPVFQLTAERGARIGWRPWEVWGVVSWCGHAQEGIPVLAPDGLWKLIPVLGEAT